MVIKLHNFYSKTFLSSLDFFLSSFSFAPSPCRTSYATMWHVAPQRNQEFLFLSSPSHIFFLPMNFMKKRKKNRISSVILFNTFFGFERLNENKNSSRTATTTSTTSTTGGECKKSAKMKTIFLFSPLRCLVSCWNLSKMVELWKCFCNNCRRSTTWNKSRKKKFV